LFPTWARPCSCLCSHAQQAGASFFAQPMAIAAEGTEEPLGSARFERCPLPMLGDPRLSVGCRSEWANRDRVVLGGDDECMSLVCRMVKVRTFFCSAVGACPATVPVRWSSCGSIKLIVIPSAL
jgi:hypothetical protein